MEPATTAAVSAGVGAVGSLVSGFAQNAQARRQAAVDDANAKIAQDQAAAQAAAIARRGAQVQGSERASAGASGIQGSGFADAMADSATENTLDRLTALYNGRVQARNFKAQADAARRSGTSAIIGGVMGAGTQALSGYGNWKWLSTRNPYTSSIPYSGAEFAGTGSSY